ncbi:hypothetical protein ABZP36_036040 [Zizania latifolia]
MLIRRATGRDHRRGVAVSCGSISRGGGEGWMLVISSVVEVGAGNIGTLRRQTGQELRSASHGTMQSEWYRWPQGSRHLAAPRGRASVQTAQAAAASSEMVTVARA